MLLLLPLVALAQTGPPAPVEWTAIEAASAAAGAVTVILSAGIAWYTLHEKRRKAAEADAQPLAAFRAEVEAELAALRKLVEEMHADLNPRHEDPLVVQVRALRDSAGDAPQRVLDLSQTLGDRLDVIESLVRKRGGDAD